MVFSDLLMAHLIGPSELFPVLPIVVWFVIDCHFWKHDLINLWQAALSKCVVPFI